MTQPPQDFSQMPPPPQQVQPPPVAPEFSPVSTPPRHGWFRRHLAFIIPAGCLVMLLIVALVVLAGLWLGFGKPKEMPPYRDALALARANAEVTDALGSPIKPGTIGLRFNRQWNNASGSATMSIPLKVPKGKGTLYVIAMKSAGVWTFQRLEVRIEGRSEPIDLLKRAVI